MDRHVPRQLLLDRGAKVEVKGEQAEAAPLTWARQSGFDEICQMLENASGRAEVVAILAAVQLRLLSGDRS